MRKRVDSPKNAAVLAASRLRERRHRVRERRFLVEGLREASRAVAAGLVVEKLFLSPDLPGAAEAETMAADLEGAGVPVLELASAAFAKLSVRQNPDGVAVVVRIPDRRLADARSLSGGLVLVLDGLEKPGNVGALLRTADATGVRAVIVVGEGTDVENPNVVRASQGSLFAVPVYVAPAADAVCLLEEAGFRIVAASPHAPRPHWQADLTGSVALLLGTEAEGLPAELLNAADELVSVPMHAKAADSLNVSVAGAVVLYEALRQRS